VLPVTAGTQSCEDPPGQKVVLPVMVHTGSLVMMICSLHMLLQPLASVMVTEYIPAAFTVMQLVVSPVLHK
jgi:hypothetical protein